MAHYTQLEYWNMLMAVGAADQELAAARQIYMDRFPGRRIPTIDTLTRLVNRVSGGHGNIMPIKTENLVDREVEYYDPQLVALVEDQFDADSNVSTRIVAARLSVDNDRLIRRIAKMKGYRPYNYLKVQKLMGEDDYTARVAFCQTFLENLRLTPRLLQYILWSDECLFTPNGMFNSKNYVTWSDNGNPFAYRETRHQYRWSIMVWAGILYGRIVGPVIFEGPVNQHTYLALLQDVLPGLLDALDLPAHFRDNIIFMHDGAPAHFALNVRGFLNVNYPNKWIGRGGPLRWPARSPDMNPLDYFLWGHIKQIVYKGDVQNRDLTWNLIRDAFISIPSEMLIRAVGDLPRRLQLCQENNGRHFEQLPHNNPQLQ